MNYSLLAKINNKFKLENITREKLLVYLYGICILMVLLLYLIYLVNREKENKDDKKNNKNKLKNIKKIENSKNKSNIIKINKVENNQEAEIKKIYKTVEYIRKNEENQNEYKERNTNLNENKYINQAFSGNDFFYEEKIKEEERKILKEQMLKNAITKLENIVDKDNNNG